MSDRLSSPHALALVTGTSSGIGEAVARELLRRGWSVAGVSRRPAAIQEPRYTHTSLDLADLAGLTAYLEAQVLPLISDPKVNRLGLVNNAALVALLGPVAQLDPAALLNAYAVNAAAPVLLMGWFLRRRRPGVPLRIVNVSSGAAVDPFPGLGAYASSKSALRMAGRVLATELDSRERQDAPHPDVTILSYEPGLVDTPMQAAARASTVETLPIVQHFVQWAATGALVPPALPAAEIADYLEADDHPRWAEWRFEGPPAGDPAA
jgi:benzil reductase ((S)-benzoin forming)